MVVSPSIGIIRRLSGHCIPGKGSNEALDTFHNPRLGKIERNGSELLVKFVTPAKGSVVPVIVPEIQDISQRQEIAPERLANQTTSHFDHSVSLSLLTCIPGMTVSSPCVIVTYPNTDIISGMIED